MSGSPLHAEVAALRSAVSAMARRVADEAAGTETDALFDLVGELQALVTAAEAAQLVAIAHAAAHEQRLTARGPEDFHRDVGFVDAMAPTEVSLATGIGQWAAGRRVALSARLASRFPRILACLIEGAVPVAAAAKVTSVCDGLDDAACAVVDEVMSARLHGLDPARVASVTRRVATRVAADQVAAAHRRNRRDRCVETAPGPDGTTSWWAQLPAGRSAAAWAAVTALGDRYAAADPTITTDQARADAFLDLLLTDVHVTASVTLGLPVVTDALPPTGDRALADGRARSTGGLGLGSAFSVSGALSGCELKGIGWLNADTVEALLQTVPLEVGRALLDARTGAVLETTSSAYRPPKDLRTLVVNRDGTCRMWGCDRPALTCDLDHARPWPAGATTPSNLAALCRRHHRLKQQRRWQYRLDPDGTVSWTSPSGRRRITLPEHLSLGPPQAAPTDMPSGAAVPTSPAPPL